MFRPATFAFQAGYGGYEPLSPALRLNYRAALSCQIFVLLAVCNL